jgi:hypothetical protein
MPQDPTFMDCKKVEYPPDKSVKWLESYLVDIDLELDPVFELFFKGVTTNFKPHLSLQREKLIERLVQIEFTFDDKTILFPNFENILSRPESVKKSWFLPPEFEGADIYQSKQDIGSIPLFI